MAIQTTYSQARANLAKLCDQVLDNQEVAIITRRGSEPVALIAASELTGLLKTAYLLRSPKNAQRLITALKRAVAGTVQPQSVQDLRQELGLG